MKFFYLLIPLAIAAGWFIHQLISGSISNLLNLIAIVSFVAGLLKFAWDYINESMLSVHQDLKSLKDYTLTSIKEMDTRIDLINIELGKQFQVDVYSIEERQKIIKSIEELKKTVQDILTTQARNEVELLHVGKIENDLLYLKNLLLKQNQ